MFCPVFGAPANIGQELYVFLGSFSGSYIARLLSGIVFALSCYRDINLWGVVCC